MKKKISMRLYRTHDLDLIALFLCKEFNFRKTMKLALEEFLKGELTSIPDQALPAINIKKVKYCIPFQITLDEEMDQEIIFLLNNIVKGMRNSFLKNLMRQKIVNLETLQIYQKNVIPNANKECMSRMEEKKIVKKKREIKRSEQTKKEYNVFQKENKQDSYSQTTDFLSQFVDLIR